MKVRDVRGSTRGYSSRPGRRLRIAATASILVAVLALTGCGSLIYDSDSDEGVPGVAMAPEPGYPGMAYDERSVDMAEADGEFGTTATGADAAQVPADQRFIIRTVGVRIQVDDVEDAVESVRTEVDRIGGIVTGMQVSTDDEMPVYRYDAGGTLADGAPLKGYVTVRVPADALPGFLDTVNELGTVLRQSSDESDVTQEHVDLSARLDNLNSQEERLREFFDRAENVEEMLAIERELGRVRGEIESLVARIAYLERQASMATVTIELAGTQPVIRPQGSDWGFVDAITTGIRGLVGTINAMIVVALSALPLIAVGLAIWLVVRGVIRKRRMRGGITENVSPPVGADHDATDDGVHE